MRRRLEERADFLQQLLDSQGGDVTLNTSQLSMELREGLQRSIDESRMLSCSVLEEQASLQEEMDMGGLGDDEDVEQEEWTVPELDLEGGGQEELEALARLQTATQARLADTESKLAAMEKLLTTPNLSQLKVTRARRARSWGGGEREAMREGRKATSLPMEGDLDSWSKSDKAASRARMGLREDCGVGSTGPQRLRPRSFGGREAGWTDCGWR